MYKTDSYSRVVTLLQVIKRAMHYKIIYKIYHFLCVLICVNILVETRLFGYGNVSQACFRTNLFETPSGVALTLTCEGSSSYISDIFDVTYFRPFPRGDTICSDNEYDEEECCEFISPNDPICMVSLGYDDENMVNIRDGCLNKTICNVTQEPLYMEECSDNCASSGARSIARLCWSRIIEVSYGCHIESGTDNCAGKFEYISLV